MKRAEARKIIEGITLNSRTMKDVDILFERELTKPVYILDEDWPSKEFENAYDDKVFILESIIEYFEMEDDIVFIAGAIVEICKSINVITDIGILNLFNKRELEAINVAVFQKDGIPDVKEIYESVKNACESEE